MVGCHGYCYSRFHAAERKLPSPRRLSWRSFGVTWSYWYIHVPILYWTSLSLEKYNLHVQCVYQHETNSNMYTHTKSIRVRHHIALPSSLSSLTQTISPFIPPSLSPNLSHTPTPPISSNSHSFPQLLIIIELLQTLVLCASANTCVLREWIRWAAQGDEHYTTIEVENGAWLLGISISDKSKLANGQVHPNGSSSLASQLQTAPVDRERWVYFALFIQLHSTMHHEPAHTYVHTHAHTHDALTLHIYYTLSREAPAYNQHEHSTSRVFGYTQLRHFSTHQETTYPWTDSRPHLRGG